MDEAIGKLILECLIYIKYKKNTQKTELVLWRGDVKELKKFLIISQYIRKFLKRVKELV